MKLDFVRYCQMCGARIERMYWDEYVYKKDTTHKGKDHVIMYFCGWNCMRQYEKQEAEVKRHGRNES